MVELVARAMAEAEGDGWNRIWPHWMARARVAIGAMREPTEAMIRVGEPVVYDCYSLEPGEGLDENPAVPTWEAMIDAALEE